MSKDPLLGRATRKCWVPMLLDRVHTPHCLSTTEHQWLQEDTAARVLKWRGAGVVWLSFETNSLTTVMSSPRRQFDTVFAFEPFATKVRDFTRSLLTEQARRSVEHV